MRRAEEKETGRYVDFSGAIMWAFSFSKPGFAHITYVKAHNASVSFDRMLTEIDGSEEEEE